MEKDPKDMQEQRHQEEIAAQLVNEAKGRGHDDDRTVMVMKIEKLE